MTYSLISDGCYPAPARRTGLLYTFPVWEIPKEISDPAELLNQDVMIDGRLEHVIGVDRFAILEGTPEHPYLHNFGLLVKEGTHD